MASYILVCVLVCAALVAVVQAERNCGPYQEYIQNGRCAACGADCSGGRIPCPADQCRTGCQCIPGYTKVRGVCKDTRNCGGFAKPPLGPVN